ncbi:SAM-dependent methyltransferase [Sciscionella sediminilitoris]|uniref:SAM-dependent methyltransferase n=1 Tax=Sciscionella sediminilitoris TaxID=1445613 RepID=UPI0004DEF324|nr:cyclopropane-fatty-acyl-phospholipid synthase family protein [Sciscionella sp. SE31]
MPADWPDIEEVPHAPLRAAIARVLFHQAVRTLPVRVVFPDATMLGGGTAESPVLRVVRPGRFYHRLGAEAKIGFGEGYMAGDWTSTDLAGVLAVFAGRISTLVPPALQRFRRLAERTTPKTDRNTVEGARRNIHHHYDLSNELFASFLDETMTYSAAWFGSPDESLESAQLRKIDGLLDYAGVGAGSQVLEIGTGWGSLAVRAAERGAEVTTVTVSAEQFDLACNRVATAGVADRVRIRLQDYREITGTYDAILSVEMFEAVGMDYWPVFFRTLERLLRTGGRIGLQTITMPHDRMLATRRSYTWIHKYIFPGGMLPSVQAIEDVLKRQTGLRILEQRSLGADYARTLRLWRERFLEQWPRIEALGFDDTFHRMWEFYLAYSEAGFLARYLDDWQLRIGP